MIHCEVGKRKFMRKQFWSTNVDLFMATGGRGGDEGHAKVSHHFMIREISLYTRDLLADRTIDAKDHVAILNTFQEFTSTKPLPS